MASFREMVAALSTVENTTQGMKCNGCSFKVSGPLSGNSDKAMVELIRSSGEDIKVKQPKVVGESGQLESTPNTTLSPEQLANVAAVATGLLDGEEYAAILRAAEARRTGMEALFGAELGADVAEILKTGKPKVKKPKVDAGTNGVPVS